LGWEAKTKFKDLVRLMVHADLAQAEKEAYVKSFHASKPSLQGKKKV
jgi:hypothetical protein